MHDAYDEFVEYDREHENWLLQLPRCDVCGQPIQDDYYYEFGDDKVCCECLGDYLKQNGFRVENIYL